MSNVYQPKRKEWAKVKTMTSEEYYKNRSKYKYVGSVNRGYTNFVTTTRNKKTRQCSYIDDTSSLTKKTKNEITKFFSNDKNSKKGSVYLVVDREPKIKNNTAGKTARK